MGPDDLSTTLISDLVLANHILAYEEVLDEFGHVSVRHPDEPGVYVIGRSLSPEHITRSDLQMFHLGGERADTDDRVAYAERAIHGAVYETRPDVQAICHNHAPSIIPFTVTDVPLRPMSNTSGLLGPDVPVWDIRCVDEDTDLLVRTMPTGRSLAATLGHRRVALMRGHGSVVAGASLREVVLTAVWMEKNAKLQMKAMALGEPTYLSAAEIERNARMLLSPVASDRVWGCWAERARPVIRDS